MAEMGTFVAILLGNLAGGLLIPCPPVAAGSWPSPAWAWRCWAGSRRRFIPGQPSTDPDLDQLEPGLRTWPTWLGARSNIAVFRSLLGIVDVVLRRGVPRHVPGLRQGGAARRRAGGLVLLVVFSIGIGIGSLLCESSRAPPRGDRPGAAGRHRHERVRRSTSGPPRAVCRRRSPPSGPFWPQARRTGACWPTFLLALFAGIQRAHVRADPAALASPATAPASSRANNILNALFMIASSCWPAPSVQRGSIPEVFLWHGLANAVVGVLHLIHRPRVPAAFLRLRCCRAWVYRLQRGGDDTSRHRRGGAGLQPRQLLWTPCC